MPFAKKRDTQVEDLIWIDRNLLLFLLFFQGSKYKFTQRSEAGENTVGISSLSCLSFA
jgi:hypothetical protein